MRTTTRFPRRRPWTAVLVTAATALVLAACGGAPAGPGAAVESAAAEPSAAESSAAAVSAAAGVHDSTPEEQRQSDRDTIRQFYPDMTDAEADAYNAASQSMMQLAYVLEQEHRESFAYSVVADSKHYSTTIHFKNASPEVLAQVEEAGIPGVTVDNTAEYTKDEQLALVAAAFDPVSQRGLTTSMSGGYDWEHDLVTIDVEPKPGLDLATVVAGAPSVIALPGVVDAAGRPTQTPVVYAEFGGVRGTVGDAGAGSDQATSSTS